MTIPLHKNRNDWLGVEGRAGTGGETPALPGMSKAEGAKNTGLLGTDGPPPRNHHCMKDGVKGGISCGGALQKFVCIKQS